MTIKIIEVGGAVRDRLLGINSKDVDFVVLAPSFEVMRDELISQGFKIFQEKPEFVSLRAHVPDGHRLLERTKVADFTMARRDGPSLDGRRPDFVEPGSLMDDLSRRDFTINAMAIDESGDLIDPFMGRNDLASRTLRFVGNPMERIQEDGLRVLRGFRFCITKGLTPTTATSCALRSDRAAFMLKSVSIERIREELHKMFSHDTFESLRLICGLSPIMRMIIFRGGLKLLPSLKD